MDVESRDYASGETFSEHPLTKDITSEYVMDMEEAEGDTSESDNHEDDEDGLENVQNNEGLGAGGRGPGL